MKLKELTPTAFSLLWTVNTQVRCNGNLQISSDSLPKSPSEDNFSHLYLGKTKQNCWFSRNFASSRIGYKQTI